MCCSLSIVLCAVWREKNEYFGMIIFILIPRSVNSSISIPSKIPSLKTKTFEDCSLSITLSVGNQAISVTAGRPSLFWYRSLCIFLGWRPAPEHSQCHQRRDWMSCLQLSQSLAVREVCLQAGRQLESSSECGWKYFSWIGSSHYCQPLGNARRVAFHVKAHLVGCGRKYLYPL